MKHIFLFVLSFCAILAAADRLATGVVSVQQVLDDGRVAMIAPGDGKEAPFLAGYLASSSGEKTLLFACEPEPNFFNFSWEAKSICGTHDGKYFWCISRDQIGTELYQDKLHCWGESGLKAKQFEGRKIFISSLEEGMAYVLVYQQGKVQWGWLQGMSFTATQEMPLPDDTGLLPAVSADCGILYYLREDAEHTVTLCRVDTYSSEVVDLENLGERTELGVYAGEYLKDLQAVSCSADGSVAAFHFVDGMRGLQLRLGSLRGDGVFVAQTVTTDGGSQPRLAGNGRFLVYSANGALWRYDSHSQNRQRVSEGENGASQGAVLSPNGCWCAWVDDAGTLWRERFDAWIALDSRNLRVPCASKDIDFGLRMHGASAENTILWNCVGGMEFPGRFFCQATGEEIPPNVPCSGESLPWMVETEEQCGKWKLRFVLDNGDVEEMEVLVSDFSCMTPWLSKELVTEDFFYRSLHFPTENAVDMLTNAPLLVIDDKRNSVDGYLCDFTAERYSRNLADVGADDLVVSLDGVTYRVRKATGTLLRDEEVLLADGVSTEEAPGLSRNGRLAVIRNGALLYSDDRGETFTQIAADAKNPRLSVDGMVLAWVSRNALHVRSGEKAAIRTLREGVSVLCGMTQNGEYFLFRNAVDGSYAKIRCNKSGYAELKNIPKDASNVLLSSNGRRVLFEAKEDDKDKTRVYVLDWKEGGDAEAVCLMPKAIQGAREAALGGSGRYAAFSTYADMEMEGTQLAENGQCNLYLWTDHAWKNLAPVIINTQLAEVLEDSADTNLRLSTTDGDDDATVVTIAEAPRHGTAYLLPPDQTSFVYRLYYTPEKDFCGEDTIGVCLSDGCKAITRTLSIPVRNVNDPPEWDSAMPTAVTLPVGEVLQVPLLAHDVDLDNPAPDSLEYSLAAPAPEWCAVSSAENRGTLQLSPGWEQLGTQMVTVQVSDGLVSVPWTIQVTVVEPAAVEISAALLLDSSLAPLDPKSGAERLQAYVAGCWEELVEGEWQLLSLPAEADVAALCRLLGTMEIVVCNREEGYRFRADGVLPAGEGFWVRPRQTPEGTLMLQPATSADGMRFRGPVWLEKTPEESRQEVLGNAWRYTDAWQVGRAYFQPPAEK